MTEQESLRLIKSYCDAFPLTAEWLKKVDSTESTLKIWSRTLFHTSYEDGRQAVADIIDGVVPPVPAYERDHTALHIRSIAERIADKRRQLSENERVLRNGSRHRSDYDGMGMGGLYRKIVSLWDEAAKLFPDEVGLPVKQRHKSQQWVNEQMEPLWPTKT